MGIVYWAIDTDLNREVAFKVVRPGVAGGRRRDARRAARAHGARRRTRPPRRPSRR